MFKKIDVRAFLETQTSGSVMILAALIMFVLFGMAGLAVDVSRAQSVKASLQQDIDRAALFLGTRVMSGEENINLQAEAQSYIDGLRRQTQVSGNVVVTSATLANGVLTTEVEATVPTLIMQVLGEHSAQVNVTAEVELQNQPIEVALALDTTGSMAGSKIDSLKSAAKELIEVAFAAPGSQNMVKLGIVPFSDYVNVGMQYRNASWLDVKPDQTSADPKCSWDPDTVVVAGTCQTISGTGSVDGGASYDYTAQTCDFQRGTEVVNCWTDTNFAWYGCVGSRQYPLNVTDDNYTTRIPGLLNTGCGQPITPLASDKDALKADIDSLTTGGETYIPEGLMWGWRILSKDEPFGQANGYTELVDGHLTRKILVLMTDGRNSRSKVPDLPFHWWDHIDEADALTQEVCTNIKAAGIEIYTVGFAVDDDSVNDVLRACASGSTKFFGAENSEELKNAFGAIAKDFAALRLSK